MRGGSCGLCRKYRAAKGQMEHEQLNKIIERHGHWLNHDCEDWKTMRADLSGADLHDADLSGADLSYADLSDADLSGANLTNACLQDANLSHADLSDADLSDADLECADLRCADLHHADLRGTYLDGADLSDVKNIPHIPMACPESGAFTGWKKAATGFIVELYIPEDAERSSATGRKCRCSKAYVRSVRDKYGNVDSKPGFSVPSIFDPGFIYCVGEMVTADGFDKDRFHECAQGIHFFMTQEEAVNYYF